MDFQFIWVEFPYHVRPMADLEAFGELIRDLREKRGMSQDRLARAMGVGRVTITDIELGKRRTMPTLMVIQLAEALAVAPGMLLEYLGVTQSEAEPMQLRWLVQQLDERNRRVLTELGYALLRVQQDQPQTEDPPGARPAPKGR